MWYWIEMTSCGNLCEIIWRANRSLCDCHSDACDIFLLILTHIVLLVSVPQYLRWLPSCMLTSCSHRGLDSVCEWNPRGGSGRRHHRQVCRVWRHQEYSCQSGQTDWLYQGGVEPWWPQLCACFWSFPLSSLCIPSSSALSLSAYLPLSLSLSLSAMH